MDDLAKWVEQAKIDIHYNGSEHSKWQVKFLELHEELVRANKIINKLLD